MKRGGNLQRRTPLKADPAKTAAFVQRGRGKLEAAASLLKCANCAALLSRRVDDGCPVCSHPIPAPPAKQRVRRRSSGWKGWKMRVFALYGDRCIACGKRATQAHHVVGRAVIMAAAHLTPEERAALEYDEAQGVPVCTACHMDHEAAAKRIPFLALPPGVIEWAIFNGFRTRIMDKRVYPRGER